MENFKLIKQFVMVHPKDACDLELNYYFWLQLLNEPQSDVVVFAIITLHIYKIWYKKGKTQ